MDPKLNVHPSSSLTMVAERKSPMGYLSTPVFSDFAVGVFRPICVLKGVGHRACLPCAVAPSLPPVARSRQRQPAARAPRPSSTRFLFGRPWCGCAAGCSRTGRPPRPCRRRFALGVTGQPRSWVPMVAILAIVPSVQPPPMPPLQSVPPVKYGWNLMEDSPLVIPARLVGVESKPARMCHSLVADATHWRVHRCFFCGFSRIPTPRSGN